MFMSASSAINFSVFILWEFSNLDYYYPWLSVPFFFIYVIIYLGHWLVLHVIQIDSSL